MAVAGVVVEAGRPDGAYTGEVVRILPVIRNTGDVLTWFAMELNWADGPNWMHEWGINHLLKTNAEAVEEFTVIMPRASTDFYVRLMAVNPDTDLWEQVHVGGPYRVAKLSENAYSAIIGVHFPARIRAGATESVVVVIRNTGRLASWIGAQFTLLISGVETRYPTDTRWIEPNALEAFRFDFTMPPVTCQFFISTIYVNPLTDQWEVGDITPWSTLVLDTDEYKAVRKPAIIHGFLTGKWCNVYEGQWFNQYPIVIPWWSFTPGIWAEEAIDKVIEWINWIIDRARGVWIMATDAFSKAWESFGMIDDWIIGFASRFYTQVTGWWSSTWANVQAWVRTFIDALQTQVNQAFSQITGLDVKITNLVTDYESFKKNFIEELKRTEPFGTVFYVIAIITFEGIELLRDLPDFLKNPGGWIFDKIDDWLNEPVE